MALLGELRIGLGVEPPAHTMGVEVDIFLKRRRQLRTTVMRAMPRRVALGWMPTPSLASSTIRVRSATCWAQVC